MNNQKCPVCKECLDLYFLPDGKRYYICFLCGKYYRLTLEGIKEVEEGSDVHRTLKTKSNR